MDEVQPREWSAILREVSVQARCMTWLFAYFDMSWVVQGRGGGGHGVKFHARARMRWRWRWATETCKLPLDTIFIIMAAKPNA